MVPKFVLKRLVVAKRREKIAHAVDDAAGTAIAFGTIGDSHSYFDHILYISSVFWEDKFFHCCELIIGTMEVLFLCAIELFEVEWFVICYVFE